jgi:uncharacterized ferritin-like protein (DUF455 family)
MNLVDTASANVPTPAWTGFTVLPRGELAPGPRAITSREGIADRLRAAAFAEIQAREAFAWAAAHFEDAPSACRTAWKGLALAEDRHLNWLLRRLEELGFRSDERPVSDHLWVSLRSCTRADEFAHLIARAEERGRKAGERFREAMAVVDPISSAIFGKIADEEVEHIRLADRYFRESEFAGKLGEGANRAEVRH